jgi:hypothetical protein
MSKFYIKWWKNQQTIPTNPEESAKLWMTLLEWVRAEKKAGLFTDWGNCCDSGSGYCIAEGDEVSLHSQLLKYQPFIIFSIKPVLSVDQTIESIKRAVAAAKGK